jgi:hypothetical protein
MEQPENILINRVAESGLVTINLEDFFPKIEFVHFDIKQYLFMELILKEKDFRDALKLYDWESLKNKTLLVYCSNDAIIPTWAYMLVAVKASAYAHDVYQGTKESFIHHFMLDEIRKLDFSKFDEQRIVIKGCGEKPVPTGAYIEITKRLQNHAQSIMYGEPCSTVPIFKRPRVLNK